MKSTPLIAVLGLAHAPAAQSPPTQASQQEAIDRLGRPRAERPNSDSRSGGDGAKPRLPGLRERPRQRARQTRASRGRILHPQPLPRLLARQPPLGLPWGAKGAACYHHFEADRGPDLGREVDAVLRKQLSGIAEVLAKYAHFEGQNGLVDVDRFWLDLSMKF